MPEPSFKAKQCADKILYMPLLCLIKFNLNLIKQIQYYNRLFVFMKCSSCDTCKTFIRFNFALDDLNIMYKSNKKTFQYTIHTFNINKYTNISIALFILIIYNK